jgi:hypothetical protein
LLSLCKFDINELKVKSLVFIATLWALLIAGKNSYATEAKKADICFYGDTIRFTFDACELVDYNAELTPENIRKFYNGIVAADYDSLVSDMLAYKAKHKPDDWVYYQLIRKVAQYLSPKQDNYIRYTLYKWFLLNKSGYNSTLNIAGDKLLLYVQSDENIYDIPFYTRSSKQYICLNYHDYGTVDRSRAFTEVAAMSPEAQNPFSYRLTQLPSFSQADYKDKELDFNYNDRSYTFNIKVNTEVGNILKNYPVADYKLYFNAPLSSGTYNSLIPALKKNVKGMSTKEGVDYLMRFTRYAFLYEPDVDNFGKEKRLSPEQTLLYDRSDCEDRAALFYCLVKEIYGLPMIVLEFPKHVTIAVRFDKPVGKPIIYNGNAYSICEPTPQAEDLRIGELSKELKREKYSVAFAYEPQK